MSKQLKKGQTDNDDYHRCDQTRCEYYINGGCKACSKCGSNPYEMRNDCQTCFDCENKPDSLRWGEKNKPSISEAELHKAIVTAAAQILLEKAMSEGRDEIQVVIKKE